MIRHMAALVLAVTLSATTVQAAETAGTETLYQRLGGAEGVRSIVRGTLERHVANPKVAAYFQHLDLAWLENSVVAFFSAGTGGPNEYTGRDMGSVHAHLKLNDEEFDSAVADVLASVDANGADQATHDEVQAILLSFRPVIVVQN